MIVTITIIIVLTPAGCRCLMICSVNFRGLSAYLGFADFK